MTIQRVRTTDVQSIMLAVVLALLAIGVLQGCSKVGLIPAKKITGLWATDTIVVFYKKTDSCGSYQRYYSIPLNLTMDINYMNDNVVQVLLSAQPAGVTARIDSSCNVNTAIVFAPELRGVVSLSEFIVEEPEVQYDSAGVANGLFYIEVGTFDITDNTITGTLGQKNCTTFCTGYETDIGKCKFTRRN